MGLALFDADRVSSIQSPVATFAGRCTDSYGQLHDNRLASSFRMATAMAYADSTRSAHMLLTMASRSPAPSIHPGPDQYSHPVAASLRRPVATWAVLAQH